MPSHFKGHLGLKLEWIFIIWKVTTKKAENFLSQKSSFVLNHLYDWDKKHQIWDLISVDHFFWLTMCYCDRGSCFLNIGITKVVSTSSLLGFGIKLKNNQINQITADSWFVNNLTLKAGVPWVLYWINKIGCQLQSCQWLAIAVKIFQCKAYCSG